METKDLEVFVAVYESGSLSKAAARGFVSVQAVSKTIRRLEIAFDRQLFVRNNRGVEPTVYAERLYPEARKALTLIASMGARVCGLESRRPLRVMTTSGYLFVSSFLDDFDPVAAGTEIDLHDGNDEQVYESVVTGRADCGFLAGEVDTELFDSVPFTRHPFVLVMRDDDSLASREFVSYQDLNDRDIAIIGPGFASYDEIQSKSRISGATPAHVIETAEIFTAINMVVRRGILCIDVDCSVLMSDLPGLHHVPFEDANFTCDVSLITRKGMIADPLVGPFIRYCLAWRDATRGHMFPVEGATVYA